MTNFCAQEGAFISHTCYFHFMDSVRTIVLSLHDHAHIGLECGHCVFKQEMQLIPISQYSLHKQMFSNPPIAVIGGVSCPWLVPCALGGSGQTQELSRSPPVWPCLHSGKGSWQAQHWQLCWCPYCQSLVSGQNEALPRRRELQKLHAHPGPFQFCYSIAVSPSDSPVLAQACPMETGNATSEMHPQRLQLVRSHLAFHL